jgi:putative protease
MKKPELLAPVGNMEALKAAVLAGCDAVYLGGKFFGARNFAGNFTDEEMKEAICYAHVYGVKIYVTLNTLVYEKEVKTFLKYVEFLYQNHVDAIIIQDIGMMDLVRQLYPNLEIHASTQMHIHNVEGVKLIESLGLKRVVIARETPLSLLKQMKKETNIELEVFVQGALCVSYSGQCLMSSLINGRSGNRGTCSQCCRMPYDLIVDGKKVNKEKYLLSPKDLNCLNHLEELIKLGIDSFKIEGRMKRKEYVYFVVSLYRKAIDSYFEKGEITISEEEWIDLKKIFNREFTKGFLNYEKSEDWIHSKRPNHMGIEIGEVVDVHGKRVSIKLTHPLHIQDGIRILESSEDIGCIIQKMFVKGKNVDSALKGEIVSFDMVKTPTIHSKVLLTSDYLQLKGIENSLKTKTRKVLIEGKLICKENFLCLQINDGKHQVECISPYHPEKANHVATSKERMVEQIKKLGGTPFSFSNLETNIDDNLFVSIQALNELRRDATSKLEEKRQDKREEKRGIYQKELPNFKEENGELAFLSSFEDYLKYKDHFQEFIVEEESLYEKIKQEKKVIYKLPRVLEKIDQTNKEVLVGELGSIYCYPNCYTDFSLNVVNSYSVAFLHSLGVKRVTLSYELNDYQIENIVLAYKERYHKNPSLEVIVSSYPEAMVLKYDLLKTNHVKGNHGILRDTFKNNYPIIRKNNLTTIYHSKKIEKENPKHYFDMGIHFIRYDLRKL